MDGGEGAVYGNFHNYYSFNAVNERMQFLPDLLPLLLSNPSACTTSSTIATTATPSTALPATFSYLDVGCNEGDVTLHCAAAFREMFIREQQAVRGAQEHYRQARIRGVGVDIDAALIRRANSKAQTHLLAWQASSWSEGSRSGVATASVSEGVELGVGVGVGVDTDVAFVCGNIMEAACQDVVFAPTEESTPQRVAEKPPRMGKETEASESKSSDNGSSLSYITSEASLSSRPPEASCDTAPLPVPCEHYIYKGACKFGDACRYAHTQTQVVRVDADAHAHLLGTRNLREPLGAYCSLTVVANSFFAETFCEFFHVYSACSCYSVQC